VTAARLECVKHLPVRNPSPQASVDERGVAPDPAAGTRDGDVHGQPFSLRGRPPSSLRRCAAARRRPATVSASAGGTATAACVPGPFQEWFVGLMAEEPLGCFGEATVSDGDSAQDVMNPPGPPHCGRIQGSSSGDVSASATWSISAINLNLSSNADLRGRIGWDCNEDGCCETPHYATSAEGPFSNGPLIRARVPFEICEDGAVEVKATLGVSSDCLLSVGGTWRISSMGNTIATGQGSGTKIVHLQSGTPYVVTATYSFEFQFIDGECGDYSSSCVSTAVYSVTLSAPSDVVDDD
jgi:hypothetical protein